MPGGVEAGTGQYQQSEQAGGQCQPAAARLDVIGIRRCLADMYGINSAVTMAERGQHGLVGEDIDHTGDAPAAAMQQFQRPRAEQRYAAITTTSGWCCR